MATLLSVVTTSWRPALLVCALALTGCDALNPPDPTLALTLDGSEVRETTIDDGVVQSGEYVVVDFFLTNTADSAYVNVAASVATPGPTIGLQAHAPGPERSFHRIEPGQAIRVVVEFKVTPDTPAGTTIPLALTLTTSTGVAASYSATLTTGALPYSASAEDVAVTQDTDGDGRVESGEEATVRFTPRFTGEPGPTALCGEYRVTSPLAQVVFLGQTSDLCYTSAVSFRFRASSTLAAGTSLPFAIRISDRLGNTWTSTISVPLG